jgi:hypothetical protein
VCRIAFKANNCCGHASMTNKVSSAYYSIAKSDVYPTLIDNLSNLLSMALLIIDCNRLAGRTKSKGDRGSHCLSPLLQWNTFPGTPFNKIEEVTDDKNFVTQ